MALAFATLLTTACSREIIDDEIINDENIEQRGYPLPVTVNVTREGDEDATKATFNETTKKLEFSTGDQLFVRGESDYGFFAGTLDWVSEGTFSGTIYTAKAYAGTVDALLNNATVSASCSAVLLPADYDTYEYLSISNPGTYSAYLSKNANKAFATTKAAAVEQFSYESAFEYSSGFALSPTKAILNFTITGLSASTNVTATLTKGSTLTISGDVTTDGSGNASFAMAVTGDINLNTLSLTVGGNAITLASGSKTLEAGKIYNVTRSAIPLPEGALSGKFTISNDGGTTTSQVRFSKGNLQYTKSTSTWSFMEQQYSTVETNASPYCTDDYGDKDVVSLFGWATSGYNHGATCYQPYSTNTTCSRYYAYGNSSKNLYDQTGQADWGYNAISNGGNTENSGWRTLTRDEWRYLFNTRTTGGTVFGTSSARYAHATIRTDVSGGVNGIILFPDGLSIAASEVTTAGTVNVNSAWGTKCTSAEWTALAAKGCVFLPAAGERFGDNDGVTVRLVGSNGCYWASTYYSTDNGGHVAFGNNFLSPYGGLRRSGHSVRLVRAVE